MDQEGNYFRYPSGFYNPNGPRSPKHSETSDTLPKVNLVDVEPPTLLMVTQLFNFLAV